MLCAALLLEHQHLLNSCVFYFKDSIEANVESSEVHVERATDQLQRAAYYQVKAGTKESHFVL